MSETHALIRRLADDVERVTPLPSPWRRASIWLGFAVAYVALIVFAFGLREDISEKLFDSRFIVEELAAIATALAAAFAAFWATVPGRSRWPLFLPALPLAVWLGSLGQGCVQAWQASGLAGPAFEIDLMCLPKIALIGLLPAAVMAIMIRRGAPLYPHVAVALGGLAAAALGNVGLRLFHTVDASLMVLVWQFGSVALLAALAGLSGPLLHRWPQALAASSRVGR
jgi:hypothetical protein